VSWEEGIEWEEGRKRDVPHPSFFFALLILMHVHNA